MSTVTTEQLLLLLLFSCEFLFLHGLLHHLRCVVAAGALRPWKVYLVHRR